MKIINFKTIIVYLFSMTVKSIIERLVQKYYNKQLTNEKGLFFVCFLQVKKVPCPSYKSLKYPNFHFNESHYDKNFVWIVEPETFVIIELWHYLEWRLEWRQATQPPGKCHNSGPTLARCPHIVRQCSNSTKSFR